MFYCLYEVNLFTLNYTSVLGFYIMQIQISKLSVYCYSLDKHFLFKNNTQIVTAVGHIQYILQRQKECSRIH